VEAGLHVLDRRGRSLKLRTERGLKMSIMVDLMEWMTKEGMPTDRTATVYLAHLDTAIGLLQKDYRALVDAMTERVKQLENPGEHD